MRFFHCLSFFVVSLFFASGVSADPSSDLKEITIEIKREADDPLDAKNKALQAALRRAFKDIVAQEESQSSSRCDSFSDEDVSLCLRDYSIDAEKFSDSFYIARISYRFSKSALERLLHAEQLPTQYEQKKYGYKIKSYAQSEASSNKPSRSPKVQRIVIFTKDFLDNYPKIKKINYTVKTFSRRLVTLLVNSKDLSLFRNLSISYEKI